MSQTVPSAEPLIPELALCVSIVKKGDTLENAADSEGPIIAPPTYHEPVVTRRELWSYYRTSLDVIRVGIMSLTVIIIISVLQRR